MTGVKFPKPEFPKPALDRHIGILSMKPLAARPYSPRPVIDEKVRSALSKYPQQRPEIMRVIRVEEAVPPIHRRVDYGRKG
jgi:hypothetical protein